MRLAFLGWDRGAALLAAGLALAACARQGGEAGASVPASPPASAGSLPPITRYSYKVVRAWPHDPAAFTQGLVYREGDLLESTGHNGQSSLRDVELATGRVLKRLSLPARYFGEGLAVLGDRAYQLTWKSEVGFIYDAGTFRAEGEFHYAGEGWGLTTDGRWLILSDGSPRIRFLDPATFQTRRTIDVAAAGRPVANLNELEWIRGEIFANVWQTDEVVRIDPASGAVRGTIDFSGLLPPRERTAETDVLNGIAYDPGHDRLFVTGKFWPKLYEVRLIALP